MFMARLKNHAHFYRFGSGLIRILSSSTTEKCPSQSLRDLRISRVYFVILAGFFRDSRKRMIPAVGPKIILHSKFAKILIIGQENCVFLNMHTS
jgi:hypothetical protein